MTSAQLVAITPLIALAASVVAVMVAISVRRHHGVACGLTIAGLAVTLICLLPAAAVAPLQVTPLFLIDGYSLFFIGLTTSAALVTTLLSHGYLSQLAADELRHEEFYLLMLIATLGAGALSASVHLGSFFLSLETTSVALFVLIAYRRDHVRPIEAAIKYLVLVGVSTAMLAFGMALLYAATGALAFADIGEAGLAPDSAILLGAYVLIAAGVGFKLSLAPFHLWTPDVYEGAPSPVTGYLATVSKAAVFAVLLRLLLGTDAYTHPAFIIILSIIAIASMLAGNWLALLQNNVKRMLAYSSIAHLGYLMLPLIAGGALGMEAAAFYFAAYVATTLGAFAVIAALSPTGAPSGNREAQQLEDYRGLFWRRPWLAGVFTLMLLSLAGIPLTAGFPAKFYAIAAGVNGELWLLTLVLVAGSAIGLFYYLRVVITMASAPDANSQNKTKVELLTVLSLTILTVAVIGLGVYPTILIEALPGLLGR